jgi:hypothetical protein
MRKHQNHSSPVTRGFRYRADISGLTNESASELIRRRAYQLHELRGRHPGHELDDWLQAEREVPNYSHRKASWDFPLVTPHTPGSSLSLNTRSL